MRFEYRSKDNGYTSLLSKMNEVKKVDNNYGKNRYALLESKKQTKYENILSPESSEKLLKELKIEWDEIENYGGGVVYTLKGEIVAEYNPQFANIVTYQELQDTLPKADAPAPEAPAVKVADTNTSSATESVNEAATESEPRGYVCFFKGKRFEVWSDTTYHAQQKCAKENGIPEKQRHMITVVLADKGDGKPVTHIATESFGSSQQQQYMPLARGISDKDTADQIAKEEEGTVSNDDQEKDKFMIVKKNEAKEKKYKCPNCGYNNNGPFEDDECPKCETDLTMHGGDEVKETTKEEIQSKIDALKKKIETAKGKEKDVAKRDLKSEESHLRYLQSQKNESKNNKNMTTIKISENVLIGKKDFNYLKSAPESLVIMGAGKPWEQWVTGLSEVFFEQKAAKSSNPSDLFSEVFVLTGNVKGSGGRTDLVMVMKPEAFNMGKLAMLRIQLGDISWGSDFVDNHAGDYGQSSSRHEEENESVSENCIIKPGEAYEFADGEQVDIDRVEGQTIFMTTRSGREESMQYNEFDQLLHSKQLVKIGEAKDFEKLAEVAVIMNNLLFKDKLSEKEKAFVAENINTKLSANERRIVKNIVNEKYGKLIIRKGKNEIAS